MTVNFTISYTQRFDTLATLSAASPREWVSAGVGFMDAQVSDAQPWVKGVLPGLAVQWVDANGDGVAQLTEYLQHHPA